MSYSSSVSLVLILWRFGPIIRNGCGKGVEFRDTKFVLLLQGSEISPG